ncbi:hypothetical protein LSH36_335g01012 [Paralvinella palmiformis]|uniref:Uncharacterized protein n=1 Tax=Paralvinella palmiformis TaxID=53620 RepID=A0AAD9JFQ0_9ANNE|nr:hypothetical protein LSH36_335g01012 [Paralvinella palmiformis]
MEREHAVFLLMFAFVIIEPGSSFLFKRNKDSESGDSVAHLKRRYWNDDIQPCIEKYCLPYQGKKVYIKCLQHFCPAGLLAVPRDLDATSLFPVAMILGDTEFCADDFLDNSPTIVGSLDNDCTSGHCDVDNLFSTAGADGDTSLEAFKYGVYKLCKASLCKDTRGEAHYDCVRERCCGRQRSDSSSAISKRMVERLAKPETSWTRKRRVNDEVTQCIQSYCSGKQSHDRLVCIVKNCNRA